MKLRILILLIILLFSIFPGKSSFEYTPDNQRFQANSQYGDRSDTVFLLIIGNSFSVNASQFLPQLVKESGHNLFIGRAEIGGCPLQKHWDLSQLAESEPENPQGKPYRGKSLKMLLTERKWDVITMQQYSMFSSNLETYTPYAANLYNYIRSFQPDAMIVFHQTWAYRSDAKTFGQTGNGKFAGSARKMWKKSRAAYHEVAEDLDIDVIPVGDAFRKAGKGKYRFHKDREYDYENPRYPELPDQKNSLHRGYSWGKDNKLGFDANHASDAGCFLGSLVWYSFIFNESPAELSFSPEKIPVEFAEHLKQTALKVMKQERK